MNKKLFFISLFLIPSFIYAHTLILNLYDNEDNTILVEGVFSTGESATGAQIRLESLVTGKVLYKKRLPSESELTIEIPKEPYTVILNGGPRHQVEKEGIAPLEGFSKEFLEKKEVKKTKIKKESNLSISAKITIGGLLIAFLLILLTIFVSIRNTNRLISELKRS